MFWDGEDEAGCMHRRRKRTSEMGKGRNGGRRERKRLGRREWLDMSRIILQTVVVNTNIDNHGNGFKRLYVDPLGVRSWSTTICSCLDDLGSCEYF